jgi:heme exporter protein C
MVSLLNSRNHCKGCQETCAYSTHPSSPRLIPPASTEVKRPVPAGCDNLVEYLRGISLRIRRFLGALWLVATLCLLWHGLRVALEVPPDAAQGNVGRILYYHVPTWVAMSLCFLTNLACSILYLANRQRKPELALRADAWAVSSAEMGVIFCFLGLATGSLWGRAVWGIWWTWDARLTATLILWLIYVAYLMVRHFASGSQTRTVAAVLAIFAYCDVPIVYMSTRWWRTQHPGPVFFAGPDAKVAPSLLPAVQWNILAWLAWGVFVVALRYTAERRRQAREEADALRSLGAFVPAGKPLIVPRPCSCPSFPTMQRSTRRWAISIWFSPTA